MKTGPLSANIWRTKKLLRDRKEMRARRKAPSIWLMTETYNREAATRFMRGVFKRQDSSCFERMYHDTAEAYRFNRFC